MADWLLVRTSTLSYIGAWVGSFPTLDYHKPTVPFCPSHTLAPSPLPEVGAVAKAPVLLHHR